MQNSEPLVPFGIAVILMTAALIVIPYLRRKSDAITAWNLVLMGGAMFIGVGCLEVAYGVFHWPELQWFQPTRSVVSKFLIGNTVFYAVLLFCYYFAKWPRRLVSPLLNTWPPQSANLVYMTVILCLAITILSMLVRQVPVLGTLFYNVSHKCALFATVFSFCYWYRNRTNFLALGLFAGVFAYCVLFCMVAFVGRRLLLSVVIAPLVCMYWMRWRYASPKLNLVRLGAATFLALAVAAFYSTIRHASHGDTQRSFSTVLQDIQGTSLENAVTQVTHDWLHYIAQYTAHFTLLTIHLVDTGEAPVEPLNSLEFVAAYPIPRVLFPEKPQAFGLRIVSDVLRLPYKTNWGLGIAAYGYHEGGLPVIVLYAAMLVVMVRLVDDPMQVQPHNMFLLGILSTSSSHFLSIIRGDLSIMICEILETLLFAWGLSLLGRFTLGTETSNRTMRPLRQATINSGWALRP